MAKRYLVIKLRHHGDVLLITPVVHALKQREPDCEVDVLIYQETRDMVAAYADIHTIHCIDRQWKKEGKRAQIKHEWALLQAVRQRRYDAVVCLADQWRGALLTKASGAKIRIGVDFPYRAGRLWQHCFTDLVPALSMERHTVEQNLIALEPLGIALNKDTPTTMAYRPADQAHVEHLLREQGWQGEDYVVMHPGSRWFFKCWDDDKTAAIAQRLLDHNMTVVLSAAPGKRELQMLQTLQAALQARTGRLLVLAGVMNLRELGALIDGAALFVGVDSVPMHMAAALQTPAVALFGPSWLSRWHPWSDTATVVYAGDYGDLPHPDSIDVNTQTRYLSAIPVEAVWQAIQTHLPCLEESS